MPIGTVTVGYFELEGFGLRVPGRVPKGYPLSGSHSLTPGFQATGICAVAGLVGGAIVVFNI